MLNKNLNIIIIIKFDRKDKSMGGGVLQSKEVCSDLLHSRTRSITTNYAEFTQAASASSVIFFFRSAPWHRLNQQEGFETDISPARYTSLVAYFDRGEGKKILRGSRTYYLFTCH